MKLSTWMGLVAAWLLAPAAVAQTDEANSAQEGPEEVRGVKVRTEHAAPGYTLFSPLRDTSTYLVDLDGEVVREWESAWPPGNSVYLNEDGSLWRCARQTKNDLFHGGGQGGRIQKFAPNGELIWDYVCSDEKFLHHHDIAPLSNGNLLLIAWEYKSKQDTIAAGRDPKFISEEEGFWPDYVLEIEPLEDNQARVVWEWHVWDHLIQDFDPKAQNYGDVTDHPELVDINADHRDQPPISAGERERLKKQLEEMRALGYLGDSDDDEEEQSDADAEKPRQRADWLHTNGIDYLPEWNLILLSVRQLNEVWVIDHRTTTGEAASHRGGRFGRGGDLLYRWGNPKNYGAGTQADRKLFVQHDAQWLSRADIETGRRLYSVMVFNNGSGRQPEPWSSVDEILVPFAYEKGHFGVLSSGQAYGPADFARSIGAAPAAAPIENEGSEEVAQPAVNPNSPLHFYSSFISGCQPLANGNTLVCIGVEGRLLELTPDNKVAWEYLNPFGGDAPLGPPDPVKEPKESSGEAGPKAGDEPKGPPKSKMIPKGLFRATRISPDHPGLQVLLGKTSPEQPR